MNNKFSENLKKIRKDHNLSQEQLADEIGVSRQAISKWESSAAYPEMDKIIILCDKFNLNIDDLLHKDIREIKKEEESKKKLNTFIDDFLKYITDTVNLFSNMNMKSKLKCLFEQVIIIGLLFIISIIIITFSNSLFINLLGTLPNNVNNFINDVLQFIIILFCILSSIIIVTHIFKTRYLNYYNESKKEANSNENSEKIDIDKTKNEEAFITDKKKIIIRDPKHSEYRFISGLFKLIIFIIKILSLFLSLFFCLILICLFATFIISFLIYKTGIFFIGLLVTILSASVIDTILILIIFNFIFNRKNNKKKMIWGVIFSLIVLGIGSGMIFVGTLNFEALSNNEGMLKTQSQELNMNDVVFVNYYNDVKYIESDISNIKIEYQINKYCTSQSHIYENQVYIDVDCPNETKMIKEFIKNINDKRIIPINNEISNMKIYASKENIEILKNSAKEYYKKDEILENYAKELSELYSRINDYEIKVSEYKSKIQSLENQI